MNRLEPRLSRLEDRMRNLAVMYVVACPADGCDVTGFLRSLGHEIDNRDLIVELLQFGPCEDPKVLSVRPLG
jgi:hypothetical protein